MQKLKVHTILNNFNLKELLIKTSHCFRLGKDGEGNQNLVKIFDYYISQIQNEKTSLSPEKIKIIEEIQKEMEKRNFIRIADILEYEILKNDKS